MMLEDQQEQSEMAQKRLRIWLKIGVGMAYVATLVGFGFLFFKIDSSNQWSLSNWASWLVIAVFVFISLGLGAARNAADKIGKPSQAHQAIANQQASPTINEEPGTLAELDAAAMQRFKESLAQGRENYAKVKTVLSARYKRAKEEGKY